uniref:Uncharacterized protein n=1 Tax=Arundo donax TaxID=35708 RepID=A0A0A9BR54_ARUDO
MCRRCRVPLSHLPPLRH